MLKRIVSMKRSVSNLSKRSSRDSRDKIDAPSIAEPPAPPRTPDDIEDEVDAELERRRLGADEVREEAVLPSPPPESRPDEEPTPRGVEEDLRLALSKEKEEAIRARHGQEVALRAAATEAETREMTERLKREGETREAELVAAKVEAEAQRDRVRDEVVAGEAERRRLRREIASLKTALEREQERAVVLADEATTADLARCEMAKDKQRALDAAAAAAAKAEKLWEEAEGVLAERDALREAKTSLTDDLDEARSELAERTAEARISSEALATRLALQQNLEDEALAATAKADAAEAERDRKVATLTKLASDDAEFSRRKETEARAAAAAAAEAKLVAWKEVEKAKLETLEAQTKADVRAVAEVPSEVQFSFCAPRRSRACS